MGWKRKVSKNECDFSIDEFKNLSLFNFKRKNQWAKLFFSL